MKSRAISVAFLLFSIALLWVAPVSAIETIRPNTARVAKPESEVKRVETVAKDTKRLAQDEARCASINARATARISFYNSRKDNHLQQYQNIHDRLQTLVMQLNSRGYDTTKMQQNLNQLDSLIATASADYATFITKLEALKQIDCNATEFAAALKETQASLELFRKDIVAIRDFIKDVLQADLKALKNSREARVNARQ